MTAAVIIAAVVLGGAIAVLGGAIAAAIVFLNRARSLERALEAHSRYEADLERILRKEDGEL